MGVKDYICKKEFLFIEVKLLCMNKSVFDMIFENLLEEKKLFFSNNLVIYIK